MFLQLNDVRICVIILRRTMQYMLYAWHAHKWRLAISIILGKLYSIIPCIMARINILSCAIVVMLPPQWFNYVSFCIIIFAIHFTVYLTQAIASIPIPCKHLKIVDAYCLDLMLSIAWASFHGFYFCFILSLSSFYHHSLCMVRKKVIACCSLLLRWIFCLCMIYFPNALLPGEG